MSKLANLVARDPAVLRGITGLHFHNNCDGADFVNLLATARHIQSVIPNILRQVDWINIGGGYLFDLESDYMDFYKAVAIFREEFGLEVFMENGVTVDELYPYHTSPHPGTNQSKGPVADTGHWGQRHDRHPRAKRGDGIGTNLDIGRHILSVL